MRQPRKKLKKLLILSEIKLNKPRKKQKIQLTQLLKRLVKLQIKQKIMPKKLKKKDKSKDKILYKKRKQWLLLQ